MTVSRSTRKTTKVAAKGTAKAQAKVKAREARKRKRKELENFYKHQVRANSKPSYFITGWSIWSRTTFC